MSLTETDRKTITAACSSFPKMIPVVIHLNLSRKMKAQNKHIKTEPEGAHHNIKLFVSPSTRLAQLLQAVRGRIQVSAQTSLFLYCGGSLQSLDNRVSETHERNHNAQGVLQLKCKDTESM